MKKRTVNPVSVEVEVLTPLVPPEGWGRFRLFSRGKCVEYNVAPVNVGGRCEGFRLIKPDSNSYAVNITGELWTCECGDYEWRRRHSDPKGCKHIQALQQFLEELNLLHRYARPTGTPDECPYPPWEE